MKKKFAYQNNYFLILISSFIFLSPFLEVLLFGARNKLWNFDFNNYLFLFLQVQTFKKFFDLLFVIFSSICVYFDQKLLIIPLFCFINVLLDKEITIKKKFLSAAIYFILSLPFIFLIFVWGGIVPPLTQESNYQSFNSIKNFNLHFYHIGFASTLIALYLIPLIILKEEINFLK